MRDKRLLLFLILEARFILDMRDRAAFVLSRCSILVELESAWLPRSKAFEVNLKCSLFMMRTASEESTSSDLLEFDWPLLYCWEEVEE